MAQAFLIFRFGNEEQAQQAWHKLEGWKQGFRLARKLTAKFDRGEGTGEEAAADADEGSAKEKHAPKGHKEGAHKEGAAGAQKDKVHKKDDHSEKGHKAKAGEGEGVRVIVKLDFSDHEKLSFQRWLDRIPTEEPFKSAETEIHKADDAGAAKSEELFDSLR